jgi:PIN domain nuclease of toxin-antitoxin system
MRLLLDTHVFLWYISGDARLPRRLRDELCNPENDVWLSVVSVWEAIVKYQLKKLPLPEPPESYLPKQRERHQIQSLALDEASVAQLSQLPRIHRDPFDRMLISQSLQHGLTIVTVDEAIRAYPVPIASFQP